ncbi:MAG: PHP domain-containing protein [Clostridiales bacterium]|nr:PHP domain-containing protein [Clostridiales bacterium]
MKYLYETHFHTAEVSPCGHVPAEQGVKMYKQAGYSGLAVTDHISSAYLNYRYEGDTWREQIDYFLKGYRTAKSFETEDFSVILGMELRFEEENENDYLVFGMEESFFYERENFVSLGLKNFKALADDLGLMIIQAHPFRVGMTVSDPRYLNGIETFNGNKRHNSSNPIAAAWAEMYGLMQTSGSDFHEKEDLAQGGVYLERQIHTSAELRTELAAGRFELKR